MYQDYQNDQFQDEEAGEKLNDLSPNEKQIYEQEMNNYVSKDSILPKILLKQKFAKQNETKRQPKEKKKVFSSLKTQENYSLPKKSMSQYSVFKTKSRNNRFQSLDVNKSKTIELQQKQILKKSNHKKSSIIQSAKLKNQVSIKNNKIKLRTSNQNNRKLTLNTTNQTEVEKIHHYFSHSKADLQKMNEDQLNRINNRLHQWIERFNSRLNDTLLKWVASEGKKKNNSQNNAQKIVQLLGKHIQNNKDLLIRIEQENKKLQDKSGQMKEQQYQFLLYKQIDKITAKIKEEAKSIVLLKKKNQLSGTKIVNQQDSNVYQQKINEIKIQVVQYRKQEDSNKSILQQLEKKYLKTKDTFEKSEQLLKNLLRQAQQKQIVLIQNKLDVKWNQIKIRIERIKASNNTILASNQRTTNKISQQNKLLRNQIKQYDIEIEDINNKIKDISQKTQSIMDQQQDSMHKSKQSNSNSILFSYKTKKQPYTKILPVNHTLNLRESENKTLNIQQNELIVQSPKKRETEIKPYLKSEKEIVKQERQSQSQNVQQEIMENEMKEYEKIIQQQDINEFMDLSPTKRNEELIQQRQKKSITPKNSSKDNKINQNLSESLAAQQQKVKKSSRRFFIKKRNNQDQR